MGGAAERVEPPVSCFNADDEAIKTGKWTWACITMRTRPADPPGYGTADYSQYI